jgi:hypothetical protein
VTPPIPRPTPANPPPASCSATVAALGLCTSQRPTPPKE